MNQLLHKVALFRLSVLGPLVSREHLSHGELKKITRELAKQTYSIPNSKRVYLSAKTIERWYYLFRAENIDGLTPKKRIDKGDCRLDTSIQQAIIDLKNDNAARSINTIISQLELDGVVAKNQLARATVHRLLKLNGISKRVLADTNKIERRAFEMENAGDIWYGDVMHGPSITTSSGMRKTYLVTLMDDASRLICHSAFCLDESAISIEHVLKQALLKRGLPKRLVVDNGAAYRSASLQTICARLSINLIYCRPYEPEGKGKLERWHRTFRMQFLTELDFNDLANLEDLNARLWAWLEQIYHKRAHTGLANNMTPLERWQQDLVKIKPLGNLASSLDNYFLHRIKRLVRKDGTLSFEGKLYEVKSELADRYVLLVIDPYEKLAKWAESLEYDYLSPVYPLDKKANCHRKRIRPEADASSTSSSNKVTTTKTTKPSTSLVESVYNKSKQKFALDRIIDKEVI